MRSPFAALPVGSPLPCYSWRGRSSPRLDGAAEPRSFLQPFARRGRRAPLRTISRDLLVLSLLAVPPVHAHPTDAPINLTLTLTGTTVIAIGVALLIGAIGGMVLGAFCYAALLRAADHSSTSYRARALARIFAASTMLHATVEQLVRDAHDRITTLQSTLADIRAKESRHVH